MKIEYAERIRNLPPYLFAEIDRLRAKCLAEGADLVDLGIGDPDLPTPAPVRKYMAEAIRNPAHHRYPSYRGEGFFRADVAGYMKRRFKVALDPGSQIVATIGSKEGIANFPLLLINPGDVALVPEPGYPVYATSVRFLGGEVRYMPLLAENGFLPDLSAIPARDLKRAKMIALNYPNNPTGAVAPESFLKEAVAFAHRHGLAILFDNAYSEVLFDGKRPRSILSIPGARECCVEFHSFSKLFNMTGWRVGFACGGEHLISGFAKVKTNIDSGVFAAIQEAAGRALANDFGLVADALAIYEERRRILRAGLERAGLDYFKSHGTFYVWARVPKGRKSAEFVTSLLEEKHIVATPGTGFGPSGEGYVRFSLTAPTDRVAEAARRLAGEPPAKRAPRKAASRR